MATGGTPRPLLDKLNAELDAVLREPELRQLLEARGVRPEPVWVDEFASFFAPETRAWSKLARDNGISAK